MFQIPRIQPHKTRHPQPSTNSLMKSFLVSVLLAVATVSAQVSLPVKSVISVREAESVVAAPTPPPGKKCKLAHRITTYFPALRLGTDASEGELTWRFYIATKTDTGSGLILVREKSIRADKPVRLPSIAVNIGRWECNCCRSGNKEIPTTEGWYTDLSKDGIVVASAQSSLSTNLSKLIASRSPVPGESNGRVGNFYTVGPGARDLSKSGGAPKTAKVGDVVAIAVPDGSRAWVQFTNITDSAANFRWKFQESASSPKEEGDDKAIEGDGKMAVIEVGNLAFRCSMGNKGAAYCVFSPGEATAEILPSEAFDN